MKIESVMTTEVATVEPGTSLKDVAQRLVERRISGMPVVDAEGRVLGVISEADLLAKEGHQPSAHRGVLAWLVDRGSDPDQLKFDARVAGEAMTVPAITIGPHQQVASAVALMLEKQVNRLPVIDHLGRLVGIVTRADLLRAFARSDDEIARDIRDEVAFLKALSNDPHVVDVSVDHGQVALSGAVQRRSDSDVLPRIVRGVPGVVGVDAKLTWSEDDSG
jgi:CBS domain-containing protein